MSSSQWLTKLDMPSIVIDDPDDLFDQIGKLAEEYDSVVIDSPSVLGEPAKSVLLSVDLALVPVQPSNLDLLAAKDIVRLVHQAQKIRQGAPKAAMFLSRASRGTVLMREAQEALSKTQGFVLLDSVIYQRQAIADAPGQAATVFTMPGEPASSVARITTVCLKRRYDMARRNSLKDEWKFEPEQVSNNQSIAIDAITYRLANRVATSTHKNCSN
jgi:chromosome partitioning protein